MKTIMKCTAKIRIPTSVNQVVVWADAQCGADAKPGSGFCALHEPAPTEKSAPAGNPRHLGWEIPPAIPRGPGKRKLWLTSDEHYGHKNIIAYQNRPFHNLEEMDRALVANHNAVVGHDDCVIHVGDFSFGNGAFFAKTAKSLNGAHFFMDGSHDRAMREFFSDPEALGGVGTAGADPKLNLLPKLFEFTYAGRAVVLCHYQMAAWKASHHGESTHFYGHSHAKTQPDKSKRCRDIGVDTADCTFYPIQLDRAIQSVLGA